MSSIVLDCLTKLCYYILLCSRLSIQEGGTSSTVLFETFWKSYVLRSKHIFFFGGFYQDAELDFGSWGIHRVLYIASSRRTVQCTAGCMGDASP